MVCAGTFAFLALNEETAEQSPGCCSSSKFQGHSLSLRYRLSRNSKLSDQTKANSCTSTNLAKVSKVLQ